MLYQRSFLDSPSATSSPGSASGATPCDVPAGPTIGPSGPAHALASLSARQASERGLLTSGTCGRPGSISSASAALQSSLVSRLRVLTRSTGSTLFGLTWRRRDTPAGRSISALRASALRTSDSGCGSWPTPDAEAFGAVDVERLEDRRAELQARNGNNGFGLTLGQAVPLWLASWVSPQASDGHGAGINQNTASLCSQTRSLAGWPTPQSRDGTGGGSVQRTSNPERSNDLNDFALLAASGPTPNGSPAGTGKCGQLNPAHSRWLVGLPPAWCDSAVTAMGFVPRRRKR
jgi:hypothetical protein